MSGSWGAPPDRSMAELGRVLPLGSVDMIVRLSMLATQSCRSPFGQLRPLPIPFPSVCIGSDADVPHPFRNRLLKPAARAFLRGQFSAAR